MKVIIISALLAFAFTACSKPNVHTETKNINTSETYATAVFTGAWTHRLKNFRD